MGELLDATNKKNVSWSEVTIGDAYVCERNGYNLHMSYYFDQDEGVGFYNFKIYGKKNASFMVTGNENDFSFMDGLYSSIQVNADGLDEISEDFFS